MSQILAQDSNARFGTNGADIVRGGPGVDILYGGGGSDRLFGDAGNDTLFGGGDRDKLYGGSGADHLYGGYGGDYYFVTPSDIIHEDDGQGKDFLFATQSYALKAGVSIEVMLPADYATGYNHAINFYGNEFSQVLWGNEGNNSLDGRGGADRVLGNAGNDILRGGSGNDRLDGAFGNDTIDGGLGKDALYGGLEKDTFVFRSIADSKVKSAGRDVIQDFSQADHDRIDLHLIDANRKAPGNQAFHLIDDEAFSGKAGELQAKALGSNHTLVSGDVNGDGKADFAILIYGSFALEKGDFLL